MSEYVKVIARVKPSTSTDRGIEYVNPTQLRSCGPVSKVHQVHAVLSEAASQKEVYETVARKIVLGTLKGINGTIFAYGQTGSGKSHTMLGESSKEDFLLNDQLKGIIPMAIEELFDGLQQKSRENDMFVFNVEIKFVELYNEVIFDLLDPDQGKVQLRNLGKMIKLDASSIRAESLVDAMNVVKRGWSARRTAETKMNRESSRSHAVLIIETVIEETVGSLVRKRSSTLNLVDLAGSERQKQTQAIGDRLKEASNINFSLSVLSRVIRTLSEGKSAHVPYRDSHLTHLLKNSLGGNSKTAVIVCLHAERDYVLESLQTLHFAEACASIRNKVVTNETMDGNCELAYKAAMQSLQARIEKLEEEKLSIDEKYRQQKQSHEATVQELASIRTKYDCRLMASVGGDNGEKIEQMADAYFAQKSKHTLGDIENVQLSLAQEKIATLELEIAEQNDKRLDLEQRLKQVSTRNDELMNGTLEVFKTPGRSSRNPRRDTIFSRRGTLASLNSNEASTTFENAENVQLLELELTCQKLQQEITEKNSIVSELVKKLEEKTEQNVTMTNKAKNLDEENNELLSKCNAQAEKISELCTHLKRYKSAKLSQDSMNSLLRKQLEGLTEQLMSCQTELESTKKDHTLYVENSTQLREKMEKMKEELFQKTHALADAERNTQRLRQELASRDSAEELFRAEFENLKIKSIKLERQLTDEQKQNAVNVELREKLRKELQDTQEDKIKTNKKHLEEANALRRRLSDEQEAHDVTRRQNSEAQRKAANSFDQKMTQIRSEFEAEKFRIEEVNSEKVKAEKDQLFNAQSKIQLLEKELSDSRLDLENKISEVAELGSHANNKQKIKVLAKLKEELAKVRKERDDLRAELDVFKKLRNRV